jgi:hypothetical protein
MAAGLGFKTFTTGEVLTAADTNGYLMQGVLVFASSAARAAAITSPQEGQYSYLKDTNSTEYYDGAAWIAAPIGDITGVTAGTGISGGGTSGTVTITNSMATEIAAKGDLIVGTGAATFDNLTVGANGTTLVADSTASTGLKWATPASPSYTWTAYTPSNSNITIGNGTEVAEYLAVGDLIFVRYLLTFGTTTSITGNVNLGLPFNASATISDADIGYGYDGRAMLFDLSATKPILGSPYIVTASTYRITPDIETASYVNGGGVVQATTPFTWATGDNIQAQFWYRKA